MECYVNFKKYVERSIAFLKDEFENNKEILHSLRFEDEVVFPDEPRKDWVCRIFASKWYREMQVEKNEERVALLRDITNAMIDERMFLENVLKSFNDDQAILPIYNCKELFDVCFQAYVLRVIDLEGLSRIMGSMLSCVSKSYGPNFLIPKEFNDFYNYDGSFKKDGMNDEFSLGTLYHMYFGANEDTVDGLNGLYADFLVPVEGVNRTRINPNV